MGGFIIAGRVGGQLAVTRSIGDHALRREGAIPNPSIKRVVLKSSDRWIILASDGIWDALTEKEIYELIGHKEESSKTIAQMIVKQALDRGSKDNVTCIAIKL